MFSGATFTFAHVAVSLIGVISGLIVAYGLLTARRMDGWTLLFLCATLVTSLTGFLFPFHGVTPGIILGVLSVLVLAAAGAGRYAYNLFGRWRLVYAVGAVTALYFNVFVLIAQAFSKIPALHALAPTTPPSGPAFAVTQGLALLVFVTMGFFAARRFHPSAA